MAAQEWNERTKLLVTIAIVVVINLGLFYYFYTIYQEYQVKVAEHKKNNAIILDLKSKTDDLDIKKASLAQLIKDCEKKMKKLPEEQEVPKLIDDLSKIASKNECTNKNITFGTDTGAQQAGLGGGSYARDVWHSTWDASFMNWCKLTNEMEENFERFVGFENLNISVKNSGMIPTGTRHAISVDLVIYRYVKAPN